jgi:CxxC motif-containing protein
MFAQGHAPAVVANEPVKYGDVLTTIGFGGGAPVKVTKKIQNSILLI